jgi:transcription factor STE12
MCPNHKDISSFRLTSSPEQSSISCVNWKGRFFISGTDIVRFLVHRYHYFIQRMPFSLKKFEEGIFSDLRRLTPPQDCVLEATRSELLTYLFNFDCVRSKKKQKVFFWKSFVQCAHNLFCDAVERELARLEMARAVGMSVDDFIKSGIVPTTASHIAHYDPSRVQNDWTLVSTSSHANYLSVDQIHYIRNDISSLFHRYLRSLLTERSTTVPKRLKQKFDEDASKHAKPAVVNSKKSGSASESLNEDDLDTDPLSSGGGGGNLSSGSVAGGGSRVKRARARPTTPTSSPLRTSMTSPPATPRTPMRRSAPARDYCRSSDDNSRYLLHHSKYILLLSR